MDDTLLSVGIDVGTTSTQIVFSRLSVKNQNGPFSVPKMAILDRKVIYKSPVFFTPLKGENLVDEAGLRRLLEEEYQKAGIARNKVDTGAVIITGETSRKENAKTVVSALAGFAGDFVVATAGPDLESVLAAKGAGAVEFSAKTGSRVLHMDIGGGTSNLALMEDGKIIATGCLNVGGRLVKMEENGRISYISPVLQGIFPKDVGQNLSEKEATELAQQLTAALEMAAGLREPTPLLERLWTQETAALPPDLWANPLIHTEGRELVISFSGGVADCIETARKWDEFGDIGPVLGQAIRRSRLCAGHYRLGAETIRATVIGAGSHSLQLSGSTVFCRGMAFPVKNRPVAVGQAHMDAGELGQLLRRQDTDPVLYLSLPAATDYAGLRRLAGKIVTAFHGKPIFVALDRDLAKALGQAMALETDGPVLCLDGVELDEGSYLDIGGPVGPALPLVVKTLVLENSR